MREQILIVGMGGLGVPAACALARGKAGRIGLVDPDPVELSNLPRQVIYGTAEPRAAQGRSGGGAAHLSDHPDAGRRNLPGRASTPTNAAELIARYDFVIDATDDPAAKFLINDTCVALGRPFVYAGVLGMTGQAMTVLPGRTACLRCLFEEPPGAGRDRELPRSGNNRPDRRRRSARSRRPRPCAGLGGGVPELAGKILTYDGAASGRIRVLEVSARAGCACGAARRRGKRGGGGRERNQLRNQSSN